MAQKISAKMATKKTAVKLVSAKRPVPAPKKAAAAKAKPPAPRPQTKTAPAAAKPAPVAAASSRPGKTALAAETAAEQAKAARKEKVQPLSKSDLQYYRNLLLERRREIIGDMGSMESEAFKGGSNLSNMPIHMADVGTDNFEQEFTLGLIESERQTLREIQEALVRIDQGSYGICLGTGKQIPRVRLEAVPWAKYTIEYKRLLDQGKVAQENGQSSEEDSSGGDEDED